jgi:hypothetical protein
VRIVDRRVDPPHRLPPLEPREHRIFGDPRCVHRKRSHRRIEQQQRKDGLAGGARRRAIWMATKTPMHSDPRKYGPEG